MLGNSWRRYELHACNINIFWKIENEESNGFTSPPEKTTQDSPVKRRSSSIKVCFVNMSHTVVYSFDMYLENQWYNWNGHGRKDWR